MESLLVGALATSISGRHGEGISLHLWKCDGGEMPTKVRIGDRSCDLDGREREPPKKQEEQSKRQEENLEKAVFPFPREKGDLEKQGQTGSKPRREARFPRNLAIELYLALMRIYNSFAVQFVLLKS